MLFHCDVLYTSFTTQSHYSNTEKFQLNCNKPLSGLQHSRTSDFCYFKSQQWVPNMKEQICFFPLSRASFSMKWQQISAATSWWPPLILRTLQSSTRPRNLVFLEESNSYLETSTFPSPPYFSLKKSNLSLKNSLVI